MPALPALNNDPGCNEAYGLAFGSHLSAFPALEMSEGIVK